MLLFSGFMHPVAAQYTGGEGSGYAMAELSMVTNIHRTESFQSLTFGPNPARPGEQVSFNLNPSASVHDLQMSLNDARGRELLQSRDATILIPEHLRSGTYIVTLRQSGIITRHKLIIQ